MQELGLEIHTAEDDGIESKAVELIGKGSDAPVLLANANKFNKLVQVTILTTSDLVGLSLEHAAFRESFDSVLLGVKRSKARADAQFKDLTIAAGDIFILDAGKAADIDSPEFIASFSEIHEIKAGAPKEFIVEVKIVVSEVLAAAGDFLAFYAPALLCC